jgi:hypothetical protein
VHTSVYLFCEKNPLYASKRRFEVHTNFTFSQNALFAVLIVRGILSQTINTFGSGDRSTKVVVYMVAKEKEF